MAEQTKPSKYLLTQEHLTDAEIDQIYDLSKQLMLEIERFKEQDQKYRELEDENTQQSEAERAEILNACMLMMQKMSDILKEMDEVSTKVTRLFIKAKGALEEKLEMEK